MTTSKDLAPVGSKLIAESTEAGIVLQMDGKPSAVAFLLGAAIRYFAEQVKENPMETAMRLGVLAEALNHVDEKITLKLDLLNREGKSHA